LLVFLHETHGTFRAFLIFMGWVKAPGKLMEQVVVDYGTAVASMFSTYSCRHPGVQLKVMIKSPPGTLLSEAGGQ